MNNISQVELSAVQRMDDQVYDNEAESYFENKDEENDEDAAYDEDDQALERDENGE